MVKEEGRKEGGRKEGRKEGRREEEEGGGRKERGTAPKVRTPHKDVGKNGFQVRKQQPSTSVLGSIWGAPKKTKLFLGFLGVYGQ